jgi:hypothetical protein
LLLILGRTIGAVPSENSESTPLKKVAGVPLPGPAVRFDYQSLDASHGRLYIAHMNADQLVVFDTKKREVVANLGGFPNVHGVWAVPSGHILVAVHEKNELEAIDPPTIGTFWRRNSPAVNCTNF